MKTFRKLSTCFTVFFFFTNRHAIFIFNTIILNFILMLFIKIFQDICVIIILIKIVIIETILRCDLI